MVAQLLLLLRVQRQVHLVERPCQGDRLRPVHVRIVVAPVGRRPPRSGSTWSPPPVTSSAIRVGSPIAKIPGAPGSGGGMWPRSTSVIPGIAAHRLRSGVAPHREREPAAVAQDPPRLRQRRGRVRHQHVAEAAEHAVDAGVVEIHALGVELAELDVRSRPEPPRLRPRRLDHPAREVGRDQLASSPSRSATSEPGVAGRPPRARAPCRRAAGRAARPAARPRGPVVSSR